MITVVRDYWQKLLKAKWTPKWIHSRYKCPYDIDIALKVGKAPHIIGILRSTSYFNDMKDKDKKDM